MVYLEKILKQLGGPMFSASQAARVIGIEYQTILKWIRDGKIKVKRIHIGRMKYIGIEVAEAKRLKALVEKNKKGWKSGKSFLKKLP